jgi:hypothetical protein
VRGKDGGKEETRVRHTYLSRIRLQNQKDKKESNTVEASSQAGGYNISKHCYIATFCGNYYWST